MDSLFALMHKFILFYCEIQDCFFSAFFGFSFLVLLSKGKRKNLNCFQLSLPDALYLCTVCVLSSFLFISWKCKIWFFVFVSLVFPLLLLFQFEIPTCLLWSTHRFILLKWMPILIDPWVGGFHSKKEKKEK